MSNFQRKLTDIKAETKQRIASLKTERLYSHSDITPKWVWFLLGLSFGAIITLLVIRFL